MTTPTFVEDYNAIVDVLNKYNQGCAKADSSIMKPAFSEQATIFGIDKGKLSGGPIEALFKTAAGDEFKARLTHLDGRKLDKFDLPDQQTAEDAVGELLRIGQREIARGGPE